MGWIRDPRSGIRKKLIPDPDSGVKKSTGSLIQIRNTALLGRYLLCNLF